MAGIAGFAEACRAVPGALRRADGTRELTRLLASELASIQPGLVIHSPAEGCLPNTLSVRFPGLSNAVVLAELDRRGISVSTGSACSSGNDAPSHVLQAIGLGDDEARETIRVQPVPLDLPPGGPPRGGGDPRPVEGRSPSVGVVRPSEVTESFLADEENYVLDVRFGYERKLLRGLPGSHEASFVSFRRYLHHLPRDRRILVVCMAGIDATVVAHALQRRGHDSRVPPRRRGRLATRATRALRGRRRPRRRPPRPGLSLPAVRLGVRPGGTAVTVGPSTVRYGCPTPTRSASAIGEPSASPSTREPP